MLVTVRLLVVVLVAAAGVQRKPARYRKSYASDMEAFVAEVGRSYPFLDLKGIRESWEETSARLLAAAPKCRSDADFMMLVIEGIGILRDAHMDLRACEVELPAPEPEFFCDISFLPATEDRVVVMHPPSGASLKTGMVVETIDGEDARTYLEARALAAWEQGGGFSSPQRARLFEYRIGLSGKRGAKHALVYRDGKRKKKVTLSCRTEIDGWSRAYHLPDDLVKVGRSFYYTRLDDGAGYMWLRRVDSSISEGIAEALREHPQARGWIVDLRGNSGGGYDEHLVERVKSVPGPVAVIADAGCISAGETLVRDFVRYRDARFFGATTAGSSTSKYDWTFPSGIATIRISTRSRQGPDGELIEFHGIRPHVAVEAVPEEMREGKNCAIERARAYLAEQLAAR